MATGRERAAGKEAGTGGASSAVKKRGRRGARWSPGRSVATPGGVKSGQSPGEHVLADEGPPGRAPAGPGGKTPGPPSRLVSVAGVLDASRRSPSTALHPSTCATRTRSTCLRTPTPTTTVRPCHHGRNSVPAPVGRPGGRGPPERRPTSPTAVVSRATAYASFRPGRDDVPLCPHSHTVPPGEVDPCTKSRIELDDVSHPINPLGVTHKGVVPGTVTL